VTELLTAATERWLELVAEDPQLDERREELERIQVERYLRLADAPVCRVLRPHFISREQADVAAAAARALVSALVKVARALRDGALPLESVGPFDERELALASLETGFEEPIPCARLDGFAADGGFGVCEVNAQTFAGINDQDGLAELFCELEVFRRFSLEFALTGGPTLADSLARTALAIWRAWGGRGTPAAAIVGWRENPCMYEWQAIGRRLESAGVPTRYADPRDLEYRGGRLCHGDRWIDMVLRRSQARVWAARWDDIRPLRRALRDHAVCLLNPFSTALVDRKATLAVLTDQRNRGLFSGPELQAIARHVPWTRRLRDSSTTGPDGVPIELAEWTRGHREELVLKPSGAYGGEGVVIGGDATAAEWELALAAGLNGDHVVQRRLAAPRVPFPTLAPGLPVRELVVDTNPAVFLGRVGGFYARASAGNVTNGHGDGNSLPVFVVDGRR
jgi:hypothetical protein